MTNMSGVPADVVHAELDPHAQDRDPGTGNILMHTAQGIPNPNGNNGIDVPETFEQANPQFSYTRPDPLSRPALTREQPSPTTRTRTQAIPTGDGFQVLEKNPRRRFVQLRAIAQDIYIADDTAGTNGLAANTSCGAFIIPAGSQISYYSSAELYASAVVSGGLLSILEYIDL